MINIIRKTRIYLCIALILFLFRTLVINLLQINILDNLFIYILFFLLMIYPSIWILDKGRQKFIFKVKFREIDWSLYTEFIKNYLSFKNILYLVLMICLFRIIWFLFLYWSGFEIMGKLFIYFNIIDYCTSDPAEASDWKDRKVDILHSAGENDHIVNRFNRSLHETAIERVDKCIGQNQLVETGYHCHGISGSGSCRPYYKGQFHNQDILLTKYDIRGNPLYKKVELAKPWPRMSELYIEYIGTGDRKYPYDPTNYRHRNRELFIKETKQNQEVYKYTGVDTPGNANLLID